MSYLHITYKGWTATVVFEEEHSLLDRYINMDTGQMYYTMGKQIGGKPINPNGALGCRLIAVADYWIRNPDTEWARHAKWSGALYGKDYPPFHYEGPSDLHERKVQGGCLTAIAIFLFPLIGFLFLFT